MSSEVAHRAPATSTSWKATFSAFGVAAVGSMIANSVIAVIARNALDVPDEFAPLTVGAYGFFTVVGTLVGALGWRLIVDRSGNAASLLRKLVPTVLLLSFVPDVALLADTSSMEGATTTGVLMLMLMHLAVAAVAVPSYRRFMPPRS